MNVAIAAPIAPAVAAAVAIGIDAIRTARIRVIAGRRVGERAVIPRITAPVVVRETRVVTIRGIDAIARVVAAVPRVVITAAVAVWIVG